ncbi:MAG: BatA domain-containing protein [SAR324 cluster bacterium]|nr:BatA domain-containing protein [SAR324 cluster bacterium]
MLQFLAPLWLLGLPLVALPWIWPVLKRPLQPPLRFSALFLFPPEALRRQFQPSRQEWWLKLLRSLILLGLTLLLARPLWQEPEPVQELWIRDTTASAKTLLGDMGFAETSAETALALEDLFPESDLNPEPETTPALPGFPGTPTLAQIAEAALARFHKEEHSPLLHLHLHSDFQRSQFQHYPSATQPVRWTFHRPDVVQEPPNLWMHQLALRTEGLFQPVLELEIAGTLPAAAKAQLRVRQNGRDVGNWSGVWKSEPLAAKVVLAKDFQRHEPLRVRLEAPDDPVTWDNERGFLPAATENLWVAIVTTVGGDGQYRHGLHALKSALNAAGIFSFVATTTEDLQTFPPDLILLLADHPEQASGLPAGGPPTLFIPTRLDDWRKLAEQFAARKKQSPQAKGWWGVKSKPKPAQNPAEEAQQRLDWRDWTGAETWQVEDVSVDLQHAKARELWLLTTGVSSAWGPLYQQRDFAGRVRGWLELLLSKAPVQRLGTFESGAQALAEALGRNPHLRPGDYTLPPEDGVPERRFLVTTAGRESKLTVLREDELARMQQHFDERSARPDAEGQASAERLREWLLWIVLVLVLLEVALAALRVWRPPLAAP